MVRKAIVKGVEKPKLPYLPPYYVPVSIQQLQRICYLKHYRMTPSTYDELKRLLAELTLTEEQIKLCMHP